MEDGCDQWICPDELCKCVCLTFRKHTHFECPNCKKDMVELINLKDIDFYAESI